MRGPPRAPTALCCQGWRAFWTLAPASAPCPEALQPGQRCPRLPHMPTSSHAGCSGRIPGDGQVGLPQRWVSAILNSLIMNRCWFGSLVTSSACGRLLVNPELVARRVCTSRMWGLSPPRNYQAPGRGGAASGLWMVGAQFPGRGGAQSPQELPGALSLHPHLPSAGPGVG